MLRFIENKRIKEKKNGAVAGSMAAARAGPSRVFSRLAGRCCAFAFFFEKVWPFWLVFTTSKRCLTWWFKLGFRVGINIGFRLGIGISCDGWVLGKKLSNYCPRKERLCVHACVCDLVQLHSEYTYTL